MHFLAERLELPLEIGWLVVNPRIPDKVQVQEVLQVETGGLAALPELDMETIEFAEYGTLATPFADVARYQVPRPFRYFEPHLHSHRPFGQWSDERFEQPLNAVPSLVARVIRLNAAHFVTRDQRPVDLDRHVFK
jgi:hypothetical protein